MTFRAVDLADEFRAGFLCQPEQEFIDEQDDAP